MIELVGVTKVYPTPRGPKLVLDNLSAQFPPLVSVGILGRNGAGKSTLMRILNGADTPTHGYVRRKGRISWPLGYSGGLVGALTPEENCHFVARIHGADPLEVAEFTRAFADIGSNFHLPVKMASAGMKSRVAFALSMALDFDYYLVDEAIGAGDWTFQHKAQQAMRERADRSAVLLVSHSMGTVKQWCDVYAVLHGGKLEFFEDFEEARRFYQGDERDE